MAKSITQVKIAKLKLVLLVFTVCLSAYQFQLFQLVSNGAKSLTWTPKKLWPAWEAGTQLYELMYRLPQESKRDSKSSSPTLARVALIEFKPASDRLFYRFFIEIDEGFSKLNIQREITLTPLNTDAEFGANAQHHSKQEAKQEAKQSPSHFLKMIHQGYKLSWRELSQEKASFWSTPQEYLKSGKAMIYLGNQSDKKANNQQWCRSWPKGQLSYPSLISSAQSQVQCTDDFPLPDELWPFLVMSASELKSELKNETRKELRQFELYSPLTGKTLGTLNQSSSQSAVHLHKAQVKQQEWVKQRLQTQTKYTLTSHMQTLLKLQEHAQAEDLWTIRQTTWEAVIKQTQKSKTRSVSDRHSLQEMRKVRIKGISRLTQSLHSQSWLSIDLNSPFPPIETDQQQIKANPNHIGYRYNVLLKAQKTADRQKQLQKTSKLTLSILDENKAQLDHIRKEIMQILGKHSNDQEDSTSQSILQSTSQSTAQSTLKLPTGRILNTVLTWMQSNMTYQISRGSSSIARIIERRSGDCNELSWLFVELLKSMGMQAEMLFGLVHVQEDVWAYHAWAQVRIDQDWHIVDPSRFELYPHLAYIAFSRGSMQAQEQLGSLIGRVDGKLLSSSR